MPTLRTLLSRLFRSPRGSVPTTARRDSGRVPKAAYPGDFTGVPSLSYSPAPDGRPDPGEIVWTWVPFEEDHRQGKDRPVLIIGRDEIGRAHV